VEKDVPELKWEIGVLYFEKSGLISLAIFLYKEILEPVIYLTWQGKWGFVCYSTLSHFCWIF